MRLNMNIMGFKLFVEAPSGGHIYIEINRHEFFYSREWWFEGRNGKDRHWCLDKKMNRECAPE